MSMIFLSISARETLEEFIKHTDDEKCYRSNKMTKEPIITLTRRELEEDWHTLL